MLFRSLEILDLYAYGQITSGDAVLKLGISSLEELHQQMLAADLVIPLTADGGKNDRSNGVES